MESVQCNLCERDDTSLWVEKNGWRIVRCRGCGLIYTNPRPDDAELKAYYAAEYFSDRSPEADPVRYQMYMIELEDIARTVPSTGRFLDVGCANGIFLSLLPSSYEKHGLEFSAAAVAEGKKTYGLDLRSGMLSAAATVFPGQSFDIVHSRAVLEHMQNPKQDFLAANRILENNGWFIVSTTPNIESPCGMLYKDRFRLVMPQEHIYYFSPATLTKLLEMTGFTPVRWFFPYAETPYANLHADATTFVENLKNGGGSPPYWGSVMTVYARKTAAVA